MIRNMKLAAGVFLAVLLFLSTAFAQMPPTGQGRNLLIGGDFGVNLYQRGTAAVTAITTTPKYHADRWFCFSSASSCYLTQITSSLPTGITTAEQFARTAANANTTALVMGQILENSLVQSIAGQCAVMSYYANPAANFSGAGIQPIITWGTGTAANGTAANLESASWTGQANIAGLALQPLTSGAGLLRYSFGFQVPATATQLAAQLSFNGVGTAGTTDGVIVANVQLEIVPCTNPLTSTASAFDKRAAWTEALYQYRYYYQLTETATITPRAFCHVTTANSIMQCGINFPVPMRIAPTMTYTAGFAGFTTTAETTATNCSALATDSTVVFLASTSFVPVACTLTSSTIAVGLSMTLVDNSGGGLINASAEY